MDISELLIKFNESNLPESFVSIACKIVEKKATHSAILIRYKSINYLHHFPGNTPPEVIDNFDENGWYVYKIIDAINVDDESDVGSFLQYCKRICANSQITYSYIADGSTYNIKGEFVSRLGLPEMGTCVGFCTNTLSSTLIDADASYFELEDWDDSEIIGWVDTFSVAQVQKKYPDLDWNIFNAFKKRITPIEFLTSSFINKYPIRHETIAALVPEVQTAIEAKF